MKLNHMLSYFENYFSILGTTLVYATEFGKEGNGTNFVNISLLPWVLYMCSSFWLLGVESHDFSQAERKKELLAKLCKFTK